MDEMQTAAQRNAMLVHGLNWSERRAGIFEPAPSDEAAVATTLGLVLNCLSSGLYMVCNSHIATDPKFKQFFSRRQPDKPCHTCISQTQSRCRPLLHITAPHWFNLGAAKHRGQLAACMRQRSAYMAFFNESRP